ncbi:PqqD family protein [Microbacterium sp. H1-D42]|uniref:PqqD family protein n=1 Tax=Microbacterium sp. H1-D42 TaxID=2925844 RepID=UPI001F5352F1|nr:PqqD family protein [Microbacterium sp. H1-D42]UNK70137.1 PqqD family protein [Microbacterium sp. H1-D42]
MVDDGEVVYAAPLPSGPITVLADVSALIWRTIPDDTAVSIADVVAQVASATEEQQDDIAVHVHAFLDDLVRLGLLAYADG